MKGMHQVPRLSYRLGNPQPFFPDGHTFSERAQLGMAPGEVGTGGHGGQESRAEALVPPRTVEDGYGLPEAVDCLTIVASIQVDSGEVAVRKRAPDDVPTGRGEHQGTLGGGNGLIIRGHDVEMGCQKNRNLSQPTRVVEGRRKSLGLAQTRQDTPQVTRRLERRAQGEPEI